MHALKEDLKSDLLFSNHTHSALNAQSMCVYNIFPSVYIIFPQVFTLSLFAHNLLHKLSSIQLYEKKDKAKTNNACT